MSRQSDLQAVARELLRAAERQGCTTKKKKCGVMILGKNGGSVMLHHSLSEYRGVKNMRAALRRIGVEC